MWDSFERLIHVCEEEKVDLLLLAGDLFHRQPLLRELKEVDYLFSGLTHTKVVLIAGNHDYIKVDSYYRTYQWKGPVYTLFSQTMGQVEFPELGVCVYGLSYERREIREPLYDGVFPQRRQPIEILLGHGGDEKHIPINGKNLARAGYDYVAMGHIHRPMELAQGRIRYSGSLEPTDKNDIGFHGYIRGEISARGLKTEFIPFACREYIHMDVEVTPGMTGRALREKVTEQIREKGVQNVYKITFTGFCDPDMQYDFNMMDVYGNVLEFVNEIRPSYDYEKLRCVNADNLLGRYINCLIDSPKGSVGELALYEGVRALLEIRRG